MLSVKLNRAIIISAAIGLFVAMVLSFQHLFGKEIPCLAGHECELVASHSSSRFMGIPVAFIGAAGYIAIIALATLRAVLGKILDSRLVALGFAMTTVGFLASWYLQYVAKYEIHAFCPWCRASAIMMTVLFAIHVKLYSMVGGKDDASEPIKSDAIMAAAGVGLAVLAGFALISTQNKLSVLSVAVPEEQKGELVATPGNILGDANAKVTLVEFADLCCPACRKGFPKLMEFKKQYGNKIRVVYRHFPLFRLPGHEMSALATVASEVAADSGKFWAFASAFTSTPEAPKTPDEVYAIAEGLGISRESIMAAANDTNSMAAQRVFRDSTCATTKLGVDMTPTYFLQYGSVTKKLNGEALQEEMARQEVQDLLK